MNHVLVVEDDEVIRDSLVEFFRHHGYHATGAVDGRDALDQLSAATRPPCVIVLDLMMPVMDGRAFREAQLDNPALAKIPVVIVSANRNLTDATQGLTPVAQFRKPFDVRELLGVVAQVCGRRDAGGSSGSVEAAVS